MNETNYQQLISTLTTGLDNINPDFNYKPVIERVVKNINKPELADRIETEIVERVSMNLGTNTVEALSIEIEHGTTAVCLRGYYNGIFMCIVNAVVQFKDTVLSLGSVRQDQANAIVFKMPITIPFSLKPDNQPDFSSFGNEHGKE